MTTATPTQFKETDIGLIPKEWGFDSLGNHCKILGGKRLPKEDSLVNQKTDHPYIRITDLGDFGVNESGLKYISDETHAKIKKYIIESGDIYISNAGTIGLVGLVKDNLSGANLTENAVRLTKLNGLNNLFLGYYLKSESGQNQIRQNTVGAVQPKLPIYGVANIKLPIPELTEQKEIAEILSSLDDKIELNRKINANLEKLAGSLFKKWFVDIGVELPDGWKIEPLDEIANFLNGLALQKYPAENEEDFLPVIKIRELNNGITDSTDKASTKIPAEYILKNGDIIFSWSGSLDVVIWSSGPGALNQHLFKVTSDRYPKWFYYQWTKYFLPSFQKIASDKAVTMGHIKRGHLTESKVLVPDEKTFAGMDRTMAPIIELVINNLVETRRLMDIRDSLLPRLMSGKIRVNI